MDGMERGKKGGCRRFGRGRRWWGLDVVRKERDQGLSECIAKHQFRSYHQNLNHNTQ